MYDYEIIYDRENDTIVNSRSKRGIEILNSYNNTLYGGSTVSDEEETENKLNIGRLKLEKNLLECFDNEENVEVFKKLLNSTNTLLAGGFLVRSYSNNELEDLGDLDIYVQNKHAVSMLLYLNSVGFEMNFWNMAPPYDQSFFRKNNIMSRTFLTKNNYNYEKKNSSKEWNEGDTVLVIGFWMTNSRIKLGRDYKPSRLTIPRKAVIKKKIGDDIYKVSWVDKNNEDSIVYENDISPLIKITCDLMIIPDFIDPKEIVQNFDLTFCEIWFDGKTVDATDINGVLNKKGFLRKEYTDSLLTKFNKFLIDRIRKYSKKGFNITINPNQESYDIDTHEIENLNKSKGYRYPKVESYESWFVTQVYKALICTRGRWKFKLSPTGAEIVINDDNLPGELRIERNKIKMKTNLINWLWMVQHPLENRTISNLVEISKKTNEIDIIAKLYDENYISDDSYFYYSNVLTPIQKYWFILLHFNSSNPYWNDYKEFIPNEISCFEGLSEYGNLLEKHSFSKINIQIKKRINNRKIIENHEIIPRILPSLYMKEIAKHTNINWNYKESVLRLFYNDDGDYEPNIELLLEAFSFVNDNKYKEYNSYLKKINIFLDHPLNNIYKNNPHLYNFWQKQEVIESLNILNIDESIYNTCLDLLEIEENIELQKSQEIIDLDKILRNLNNERRKAMIDKDTSKFNELENKRKQLKSQLDVLEEELQKDSINPRHRYIDSWTDVDEQFVIIIGGEPICYSISKILDMTRDYNLWLFECTGILQEIEEGKFEENERGDNEKRYRYNRFWHPSTPSVPFTHIGNILYAGIISNDDGFLVYVDVNELKSMILHIVNDGIKVFHFTDEASLTHTVDFDGVYDPYFDQVSRNHCQHGSNIMTYKIKICYGRKCLPKKLLEHDLFMNHPFKRITEINPPVIETNEIYSEKELFEVANEI